MGLFRQIRLKVQTTLFLYKLEEYSWEAHILLLKGKYDKALLVAKYIEKAKKRVANEFV